MGSLCNSARFGPDPGGVTITQMRVFVAGGAGFIGSHVSRVLLEARDQVPGFDNPSPGRRRPGPSARAAVPRFPPPSSPTVAAPPNPLPRREDDPVGAQSNPYGATKVAA